MTTKTYSTKRCNACVYDTSDFQCVICGHSRIKYAGGQNDN